MNEPAITPEFVTDTLEKQLDLTRQERDRYLQCLRDIRHRVPMDIVYRIDQAIGDA